MIELSHVTATYKNGFMGLNDANFKINYGEFVYIIGETGSGKSTIIKLLHGEMLPQKGKVKVGDLIVNEIKASKLPYFKRTVGVIFQDFKLLPYKKVIENLSFVSECFGIEENESKMRIKNVLDLVGMWNKRESFPNELSGGQQQSIVIARAMMNNPKIILADEPTGNLDPVSSDNILKLLHDINIKQGTTIIMVTHNMELIKKAPGRVLIINKGKIIKDIPKEEIAKVMGLNP